jgi:hypothetical protein
MVKKPVASGKWRLTSVVLVLGALFALCGANVSRPPFMFVVDNPTITISGASATTTASTTSAAREAQIQWVFGTVVGTYSTCTIQLQTSYDGGTTWLTLGGAASVTVASNAVNAWTVVEQLGNTSVTTSTPSAAAALGFGQVTRGAFSCTSYGTSAPVAITVIYR